MRIAALAVLLALGSACGSDDRPSVTSRAPAPEAEATSSTTGTPPGDDGHRIGITVTDGAPEGGVRTAAVDLGDQVELVITSDTADEVHVHGYDLTVDVAPGEPATLSFTADKPGVWEIELHDAGSVLLELQVG